MPNRRRTRLKGSLCALIIKHPSKIDDTIYHHIQEFFTDRIATRQTKILYYSFVMNFNDFRALERWARRDKKCQ